jgi:plasmid stability protein
MVARVTDRPKLCFASNAIIAGMGTLTIRQLDDSVKAKLRVRAAEHGKSMEEEAREILRQAVAAPAVETGADWVSRIRKLVEPFGGFDLELPKRLPPREPPTFHGERARERSRGKR